jgi:uncharacterized glyoxalase superfamily protein PhnB
MTEFLSLTPYLRYPDDDAAFEWLHRVLGFGPARVKRDANGAWLEGSVGVGSIRIDINGGGLATSDGVLLIIGVADVDAQYRRIRDTGVDIDPPRDETYGPRTCHVTDPWGYQWYFWQGEAKF